MASLSDTGLARTYEVRTFGCLMNVHDSDRLSGLLEDSGLVPVSDARMPTSSSSTPVPSERTPITGSTATCPTLRL